MGKKVLVAEGDSWFDFPRRGGDVLNKLKEKHGYDIKSVADNSHTVESMAYSKKQLGDLKKKLKEVKRDGKIPHAILLSGGGNDITSGALYMMLNYNQDHIPNLNDDQVKYVINEKLYNAYVQLINQIDTFCNQIFSQRFKVFIHGYDYPIPDGRGFMALKIFSFLGGRKYYRGPWLKSVFDKKGYTDVQQNITTMKCLVDLFNNMLISLCNETKFAHVRHVNLRNCLRNDNNYKKHWNDEFHPTEEGFEIVADKFSEAIEAEAIEDNNVPT